VHDRAFFDLDRLIAARAAHVAEHPFDHQLDVASKTFVLEDRDVLEAHQGREDLTRADEDEGASCFLGHTTSLKRLRLILGDLGRRDSPPESEEPDCANNSHVLPCTRSTRE
jgi:hypothetical protein